MTLDTITRRNALKLIWAAPTLILPAKAEAQQKITYFEALFGDLSKKQAFINGLVFGKTPEEVESVDMATQDVLQKLNREYGYEPSHSTYSAILPLEINSKTQELKIAPPEQIGKGVKSIVLVYNVFFTGVLMDLGISMVNFGSPESQKLNNDIEAILENKLLNNNFAQVKYYNAGMPGYPLELFRDLDGRFNDILYFVAVQYSALSNEYLALVSHPKYSSNANIRHYAANLRKAGQYIPLVLSQLATKRTKPELLEKLRQDFAPERLFPDTRTLRRV